MDQLATTAIPPPATNFLFQSLVLIVSRKCLNDDASTSAATANKHPAQKNIMLHIYYKTTTVPPGKIPVEALPSKQLWVEQIVLNFELKLFLNRFKVRNKIRLNLYQQN